MISFQEALNLVDQAVLKIKYPKHPDKLYAPIRYLLSMKGKRIRPVLTLLAYNLYEEDNKIESVLSPALAWEIFHNFTLMHDDVMDNADMRRSQPTVHNVWDENTAILSGDAMLILAYQHISKTSSLYLKQLLELFSATAAEICEGQQYDMDFEMRIDVSEEEYLRMIRLKTAVLLGAALKTGAVLGGASNEDAENIYDFGVNIGLAFQIKDDLLDVYGDPAVFGKNIGGDILCNKKTYLLVNALSCANKEDKESLLNWITTNDCLKEEKVNAVISLYDKIGIKEIAESKITYFYQQALTSLDKLQPEKEKKQILYEFSERLMRREW